MKGRQVCIAVRLKCSNSNCGEIYNGTINKSIDGIEKYDLPLCPACLSLVPAHDRNNKPIYIEGSKKLPLLVHRYPSLLAYEYF